MKKKIDTPTLIDRTAVIDSEKDFAKLSDKEKYTFKKRENERISRLYYVASEQEKDARLKKRFENQSENIRNCSNTVLEYTDTSKQDTKPQWLIFLAVFYIKRFFAMIPL